MENIEIVYEDAYLMAVNKPAGLTIDGLERWLEGNREINLPRAGIVHRLDKGTSGLLLIAKTLETLTKLKEEFKERRVGKTYLALVEGDLSFEGKIRMPISRSKYKFATFRVSEEGKEAETRFRVLARYGRGSGRYSLVEVKPKTGRTHQIRVHFAYLGWPLVGDRLYGSKEAAERPFLHAYALRFVHPMSGKEIELIVELTNDLKQQLRKYEFENGF